jgi:uncharacterized protein YdhG (YjbR/CyaY superfamily)
MNTSRPARPMCRRCSARSGADFAVPEVGETISYGIPTMTLHGKHLVYFGAWKHHIAVYPIPAADVAFEQEIAPYRAGQGTLRFPLRKPIPYDLIQRLATLLAEQRG